MDEDEPRARAIRAVRAARAVRDAVARRGFDLVAVAGTATAVAAGTGAAGVANAAVAAPAPGPDAPGGSEAPGASVGGGSVGGGSDGGPGFGDVQHDASVTSGADGSVTATSSSTWHGHTGGAGGAQDDPSDDMLVQEFAQTVVREDADGNFVVETYLRVVVTYQGHTYSYDGHDVYTFDPDEHQDIVLHQHESVVVHENPDGTWSVAIDASTTVEVVPDDDGQFDAAITQDQGVSIEDDPHAHGRVDLDVDQVENVDNRGGGDADVTQVQHGDGDVFQVQNADGRGAGDVVQVQQGGHGAEQVQNADTRGGGHSSQTQQAGDHSSQVQNHDGRGGAGGVQVQHAGRSSTQVERSDGRDGGPVTQVQSAGHGSVSGRSLDARETAAGPASSRLDDAIPARVEPPFVGTHEAVVLAAPSDVTGYGPPDAWTLVEPTPEIEQHFDGPVPAAPEPFEAPPVSSGTETATEPGTGVGTDPGPDPVIGTGTGTGSTSGTDDGGGTTTPDDPFPTEPTEASQSTEASGTQDPDHVDAHPAVDHTADPAHV